jgi:[ribosomal protein S5]-alanine N-acetyltransferase
MFDVLSDPAIYEYEGRPPPTVEALAAGYRRSESRVSPEGLEKLLNWIVRLPSDELAGYVQATVLESGAAYVGYEFASKYWGRGIGSTSVQAVLEELVQSYGVHTIVAVLKAVNSRSMRMLRRIGFDPATPSEAAAYEAQPDEVVMIKVLTPVPSGPGIVANRA